MTVRIMAERAALDPGDPPPAFRVRTDRTRGVVQVTTDTVLFQQALAARRGNHVWATLPLALSGGRGRAVLPTGAWRRMRRSDVLAYRAVCWNEQRGRVSGTQASTPEVRHEAAPVVRVAVSRRAPAPPGRRLSGNLVRLRVDRNRLVNPAGDPLVLRGLVRGGLEVGSAAAAGLDAADVRAMVRDWNAGVIRLVLEQERVLTRPDALADVDAAIALAAGEGAYTLLAFERVDGRRSFGTVGGQPNRLAPLPEEATVRALRLLAGRYAAEPAVLLELFAAPHVPLGDDTEFRFRAPATEAEWLALWHGWVRRLAQVVRREAPETVAVVPGWQWGVSLRSYPVPEGRGSVPGVVYAARADPARLPTLPADFFFHVGFPRLRALAPIFVSAWGGGNADVAWGRTLERELRARHRFEDGRWPGLVGWTAGTWGGNPPLRTGGAAPAPTAMGELVRAALRTAATAADSDFDLARPAGSRARWTIETAPETRAGDLFAVRGHDFPPGTRLELRPVGGGATVPVACDVVGGHLLLVAGLPAAVAVGRYTVRAIAPDGTASEPADVRVRGGGPAEKVVLLPGRAKASPLHLLFLANAWIERDDGTLERDGIVADHAAFARVVADSMLALFSYSEALLQAYAHEIRVTTLFRTRLRALANALCHEIPAGYMEVAGARLNPYLAAAGATCDVCMLAFKSGRRNLDVAMFTDDDPASDGARFEYDGVARHHRRRATRPGAFTLSAPTQTLTPLHELLHAISASAGAGQIADLYVDNVLTGSEVNVKRRARAADPIPGVFARLHDRGYPSDGARAAAGGYGAFLAYHPQLVDDARPNVMDNYFLADDQRRCRLDALTLRWLRDRIEHKLGR